MIVEISCLIFLNTIIYLNYKLIAKIFNVYDKPDNLRKFHKNNIPLLGGFIIIINLIFIFLYNLIIDTGFLSKSIFLVYNYSYISFLLCPVLIFLIGVYDDKFNIEPTRKLFFTAIIISLGILSDPNLIIYYLEFNSLKSTISLGNLNFLFTLFCILLFINAFNMMDGINALVGLYSILFLFIIFIIKVMDPLTGLLLIPLLFFLFMNINNKIFLGDNGSLLLAYLISVITIFSYNASNEFYVEEIFLLMLLPGLEIIRLSITRLIKGYHPFSADRNHFHHLLLNKYSSMNAVIIIIAIILIPILFYYLIKLQIILSIILGIIIYTFTIIRLKKNI